MRGADEVALMRQHGMRGHDTSYEGMQQGGSGVAYDGGRAGGGVRMVPMMLVPFHAQGPSMMPQAPMQHDAGMYNPNMHTAMMSGMMMVRPLVFAFSAWLGLHVLLTLESPCQFPGQQQQGMRFDPMMAPPMMHQAMPSQFGFALPTPHTQRSFPLTAAASFQPQGGTMTAQQGLGRATQYHHQQQRLQPRPGAPAWQQCADVCAELPLPVLSAAAAEGEESESLFAMVSAAAAS